mmetsp:Transcript_16312/g.52799  ORF Transcript_16312/g.52799 Transcript_16312/m.52799 type:complete len:260 (+) Transcript_16312:549-1328(+)
MHWSSSPTAVTRPGSAGASSASSAICSGLVSWNSSTRMWLCLWRSWPRAAGTVRTTSAATRTRSTMSRPFRSRCHASYLSHTKRSASSATPSARPPRAFACSSARSARLASGASGEEEPEEEEEEGRAARAMRYSTRARVTRRTCCAPVTSAKSAVPPSSAAANSRQMESASEWKVATRSAFATRTPTEAVSRSRIAVSAARVKVSASTDAGGTPEARMCWTRAAITPVFPEPAPARTRSGASIGARAARRCCSLRLRA